MSDSPTDAIPAVSSRYFLITATPLAVLEVVICNLCRVPVPVAFHGDHWNYHGAAALMGAGPDYLPWLANGTAPPPDDREALGDGKHNR